MMTQRNLSLCFVLSCFVAALVACSEKGQDAAVVPAKTEPMKVAAAKVVTVMVDATAPSTAEVPPAKYIYTTEGRRDPFQPYLLIKRAVDADADLSAQSPLQQYETLQYKLSAIIVGYGQPMAMVLAPNGKSYVVRKGMKIGRSGGTVMQIKKDALFVEERYRDFTDEVRTNMLEIKLPKREGV